jgi:hypothetical protein
MKINKMLILFIGIGIVAGVVAYYSYQVSTEKINKTSYELNYFQLRDQAQQDLKNGKISMLDYCAKGFKEDVKSCNDYKNAHGIK